MNTKQITAVVVSLFLAGFASAQIHNEIGDAGQAVGTAQATGPQGNPLSSIVGSISSATDADLFFVFLSNPASFSATTVGLSLVDTQLFLFTLSGVAVYTNDDDPGGLSVGSTLPAGNASGPLSAGTYILGIAAAGYNPVDFANRLLFAAGLPTDVRGPAGGGEGPLNGFSNDSATEFGAYTINLTDAASAVPEASTYALLVFAGAVMTVWRRRRRS
jgi:hypothetical protein